MIKVKNLTKKYGDFTAVDKISFEVKSGEILGFLGPNGAGKTTTMRILTCYLSATSGEVVIDGHDILENPKHVRQKIGYIPENTPLYTDMNVLEYLQFLVSAHNLSPQKAAERIKYVINVCALDQKIRAEISELSKGYRQRVGLAQALIHDPDILILDEPTSGLDPNQIIDIRKLIKDIGRHKTIILCTHILSEVEATCDRVIIINEGKIVGEGTPQTLKNKVAGQTHLVVEIIGDSQSAISQLKSFNGISNVTKLSAPEKGVTALNIEHDRELDLRSQINHFLLDHGHEVVGLRHEAVSFEDVFAKLTKS